MFPCRKSGREFPGKFGILIFPVSLEICIEIPGFFYISKDFSGTDIYYFDIKNALLQIITLQLLQLIKKFFCLLKIIFQNLRNVLRENACEIKIFSSICRKN